MAEFLVQNVDTTNPDREKDLTCYKRGDVIQVYPDGTCKEKPVSHSKMSIIKIPGMSMNEAEEYMQSEEDNTDPDNPVMLRRRKTGLKMENLSQLDFAEVNFNKQITIDSIRLASIREPKELVALKKKAFVLDSGWK